MKGLTRTRNEKSIQIILLNETVHVDVGENLTSVGTPVTQKTSLEMFLLERLLEKWILTEIEHTKTEVKGGPHVGIDLLELLHCQGLVLDSRASLTKRGEGGCFFSHAEKLY